MPTLNGMANTHQKFRAVKNLLLILVILQNKIQWILSKMVFLVKFKLTCIFKKWNYNMAQYGFWAKLARKVNWLISIGRIRDRRRTAVEKLFDHVWQIVQNC